MIKDALVDTTIPVVNSIFDEADRLDDFVSKLQANEAEDLLLRIAITKRRVTSLRRALAPKKTLISYLVSRDHQFISKSIQTYLRDVLDHVVSSLEKLDASREALNQSHSNCMEKVSLEIARASRRS
jgi:magnesium transporter